MSRSACLLMAEMERRESGDEQAADAWMLRAEAAPPDPVWVCKASGVIVDSWYPRCPASGLFDSLEWRRPPHVAGGTTAAALVGMSAPRKKLESGGIEEAEIVPFSESKAGQAAAAGNATASAKKANGAGAQEDEETSDDTKSEQAKSGSREGQTAKNNGGASSRKEAGESVAG